MTEEQHERPRVIHSDRLADLEWRVANLEKDIYAPDDGIEKRLRTQENWKIFVMGACVAVSGMLTITLTLLGIFWK